MTDAQTILLKRAAACLLLPNNGVNNTIWFDQHVTLYEQLLGMAGVTDLTGIVESDYETLTGLPYPHSVTDDKGV